MKRFFLTLLQSCLIGRGVLLILWPWLYHLRRRGDDYENYIRIINGPFPFSQFGSGPFQMMMLLVSSIGGLMLILIGFRVQRTQLRK